MLGVTAEQMLLGSVGAAADPDSGGRQMPSHWSSPELHIVSGSSPTGTQFLQAAGCAQAYRYLDPESDEVTLVSSGEGATSEGEFWESLNAACLENLPLVFLIQDNGYAISVPVERQTAGGNIAQLVSGFPNLKRVEVDGTDFMASYQAMAEAAAHARARKGPALVHATVRGRIRIRSPTTSASIKPKPSAQPKKLAIRSSNFPSGWFPRAFWTGRRCR